MTRLIVWVQSVVCNVENTRCPVSAAFSAVSSVSISRISPIRMTSGAWRNTCRSAALNDSVSFPTSRCEIFARLSRCRNSIGSSMVMMLTRRPRLMWLIIAASAVDLPDPVTPVTSTSPRGLIAISLSNRSDALRWTIWVMACLKLNVAPLLVGASGMRVHSEEGLSELDWLGILHADFAHQARDFGLDLVHDLHRFDDADDLPGGHATPGLDVRLRPRLGCSVERADHRGLDLDELRLGQGTRRGGADRATWSGRGDRCRRLRHDHVLPPGVRPVARLRDPDRRPPPQQAPAHLDRADLRSVLQDLHQLRDDVEVHGPEIYTSSRSSVRPSDNRTGPAADTWTSSSIRTPPCPAR